jgi:type VII secretion-associated serine protease mycosin
MSPETRRTWLVRVLVIVTCLVPGVVLGPASPALAACGPTSNSPVPDRPWPLKRLRPDLVWPISKGDNMVVAVIDSGVSKNHPTLDGQVLDGTDFVQPGQPGHCDNVGHGTLIAGIIAGKPTRSSGFTGIAPGAKILPVRVLEDADRNFDDNLPPRIANAIRYAVDKGAKIINLSLVTVPVPELADAVRYALSRNVIVVAAVGNEGQSANNAPSYPAAYDGVVGVAGVDKDGNHVQSSQTGDYVDVAAPGLEIAGPATNGDGYSYYERGGTSFAAAYISGIAALVWALRPNLSAAAVVDRILRTADAPPNGWDPAIGYGVANPTWAVTSLEAPRAVAAPSGPTQLNAAPPDAQERIRVIAMMTGFGAVALAVLVLVGAAVVRRGRRRGWRPGRAPSVTEEAF